MPDVEVYQQTNILLAKTQVRNDLCFVNRDNLFDALELNYDQIVHYQVSSVTYFDAHTFIENWKVDLYLDVKSGLAQFIGKARRVGFLKKTRS